MRYDKDEIENYVYGSALWAGLHDRILVSGANDAQFWEDIFQGKGGKSFKKNLDCPENREALLRKYQEFNPNQPIIRSHLSELAYRLMITGNPCFIYPHLEPEEPEDTRPRDSQGRVMSPKAIQWQQWEAWCSSPDTKMADIQTLRRTNPEFAEFYATTAERQRVKDDPVAAVNNRQPDHKKKVSDAVQQFAAQYRTMPSDRLKTLLSPGRNPLGPADAARVQSLYDAALSAGLL
jgi:hypothetical protein